MLSSTVRQGWGISQPGDFEGSPVFVKGHPAWVLNQSVQSLPCLYHWRVMPGIAP